MAARELCRLEGFHSGYSMLRWAMECELPFSTLRYQYNKLSEQGQSLLRAIGEVEAKEEAEKERGAEKRTHWEEKAVEHSQVGQQALYLKLGVPFSMYQEAHVWGVKQILARKMGPAVAEKAVFE